MASTMRFDKWESTLGQPYGTVLQVAQTVKSDVFAGSAGAQWLDIPGMSITFTPKFSTSKLLVTVDVKCASGASYSVVRTRLLRDSNPVYVGDAASNRPRVLATYYEGNSASDAIYSVAQLGGTFLDSPATVAPVTYKIQIGGDGNTQTIFVNRTQGDRDNAYYDGRAVSSITVMEIAQ